MRHSKHSFNIDAKNRQGLLLKIAWLSSLLSWHAVKALANEIAYYETCVCTLSLHVHPVHFFKGQNLLLAFTCVATNF